MFAVKDTGGIHRTVPTGSTDEQLREHAREHGYDHVRPYHH
jgi:hypothetical protein